MLTLTIFVIIIAWIYGIIRFLSLPTMTVDDALDTMIDKPLTYKIIETQSCAMVWTCIKSDELIEQAIEWLENGDLEAPMFKD